MTNHVRTIIAGQDVFAAQRARKVALLGERDTYNSADLCAWQRSEGNSGIIEAEIVKSAYGYSVRYASGLMNFGLIAGCRSGQLNGTLDAAVAFARKWQAENPTKRYASMLED